jgi:hypothetical protein
MALTHQRIAQGQLPSATGILYTVPSPKTVYLKSIYLHNSGTADQTIRLYLDGATDAQKIFEGVIAGKDTFEWNIAYSVILGVGQTLQGDATNASAVNYFVYGGTE